MNRSLPRIFGCAVLLAAPAGTARPGPAFSAHWTSVVSSAAGQATAVLDLKIDAAGRMRLRSVSETPRGVRVSIFDGQTVFTWRPGQSRGFRMDISSGRLSRFTDRIPQAFDYARPAFLEKAKRVGTEPIDGQLCDKYERNNGEGVQTVWISPKTHFPVRIVSGGVTVANRDIRIPAEIADSAFVPPKQVEFRDFGEIRSRPPVTSERPRN